MPEPVALSSAERAAELLRTIREKALSERESGSDAELTLMIAGSRVAAIVRARELSKRAAMEFLRSVAESLGLDPESERAESLMERGLGHRPAPVRTRTDSGLPTVMVDDGRPLRVQSDDAFAALRAANESEPRVFVWGGEPARVKHGDDGHCRVEILTERGLRRELDRAMDCMMPTRERTVHVAPPMDVVRDILARLDWSGFPLLRGIITRPRVRPDGTILSRPGYDAATGLYLYLAPDAPTIEVPESPSRDDARDAARFIVEEWLGDFPYHTPASLANTVGLALSIVARPAITGAVPVAAVDARSGQGSGKTLLLRSVGTIACGTEPALSAVPGDEEEWRKSITSSRLAGGELQIWDNAINPIESGHLANVVTSGVWKDRALGVNKDVVLPVRCCWAINGNGITLGNDMARRVYAIVLDAACERPEDREGFRHPDLMEWVRANRPALLRALLIMARAWWVAGCPAPAVKTWGSFESFVRVVGGILEHAGVLGFLANRAEFRDAANESRHEWAAFLAALHARFGVRPFTTRDVVNEAELLGEFSTTLPGDLHDAFERRRGFSQRLGIALGKSVGRIIDGYRLEDSGREKHTKRPLFRVGRAGPGAAPAGGGVAGTAVSCGDLSNTPTRELFSPSVGMGVAESPQAPGAPANGTEGER